MKNNTLYMDLIQPYLELTPASFPASMYYPFVIVFDHFLIALKLKHTGENYIRMLARHSQQRRHMSQSIYLTMKSLVIFLTENDMSQTI